MPLGIPQVLAIARVSSKGTVVVKKGVTDHLDKDTGPIYLSDQEEMLLTTMASAADELAELRGNRLRLPAEIMVKLKLAKDSLVAMIQRPEAVALKKMEIVEREGDRAQLTDLETPHLLTRFAETNPMPQELLQKLAEEHEDLVLRHDVLCYLRGKKTLEAWKARRLLDGAEPSDETVRKSLFQQRLDEQKENGSWEDQVIFTAKNLRELSDLGVEREHPAVRRAVDWLMTRPQSSYNPGMFFATDELVEEQARIIAERDRGNRLRFREIKASEKKRVMTGDELIRAPCGPRIMWPNALVLEALLRFGYEDHERVRTALAFMTGHDWCECGYQHGLSEWRQPALLGTDLIEPFERSCVNEYRYGGVRSLREFELDPTSFPRIDRTSTRNGDEYLLRLPMHIQGCEFITTRAMTGVNDVGMRRFAEAHLWRFAGRQHAQDGEFPREKYGTGFSLEGILQMFAGYDHSVSKVVVLRALPWIVDTQNEDGSWGEEPRKDASTHAVLCALASVRDYLPSGLVLCPRN